MNFFDKLKVKFYERKAFNSLIDNDYMKSIQYFEKIKYIDPNKKGLWYNMGIAYLSLKDYDKAEKCFLKELYRDKDNFNIIRALADLYYVWGKLDKAKERYNKILDIVFDDKEKDYIKRRIEKCKNPEDKDDIIKSYDIYNQAVVLVNEKEYDEALELLNKAVELDDTNIPAMSSMGSIYMSIKKDYDKTLKYFKLINDMLDVPAVKQNINNIYRLQSRK